MNDFPQGSRVEVIRHHSQNRKKHKALQWVGRTGTVVAVSHPKMHAKGLMPGSEPSNLRCVRIDGWQKVWIPVQALRGIDR